MKRFLKTILSVEIFFLCSTQVTFAEESLKINLSEAIDLALKNNRAIEQAEDDREAARWNLSAVRRTWGPRLNWQTGVNKIGGRYYAYNRSRRYAYDNLPADEKSYYNISDFPLYQSENSNTLSLSFPLYNGGRTASQIKSAEYGLNSADLTSENIRQQIKLQTTQAYCQVLQYQDLMNVRQEEMKNLSEHLENVKTQYEVGTVTMSDVLSVNVHLANSQQNFNSAQINFENSTANLNNLLGLPVDTNLMIDDDLKYFTYDKDESFCLEYALTHRPDGIAANLSAKSSAESVNQAKASSRPNISAVVSGSITGEGLFKADHSNGQERWSAGLQMNWDIFDNNVTSAQVRQAKAAQKKAESQAQQQLETIRLEVHNAYTSLRISEKNIKISADAVKQAQEQYLIAKVRYEEGVDTNLNVMDSQEKLTQAKTNYFSALYSYNTGKAQLEKAMGVPIKFDAAAYLKAVEEGKKADKAVEVSAVD